MYYTYITYKNKQFIQFIQLITPFNLPNLRERRQAEGRRGGSNLALASLTIQMTGQRPRYPWLNGHNAKIDT
jgi:hypothetical protein